MPERPPRTPRPAQSAGGGGPRGEQGSGREPRPTPSGEIVTGQGPNLPAEGPVNVAPTSHEFPAPAANAAQTTPEQTAQAETKPTPETEE